MLAAWEPWSPTVSMSEGLCALAHWMSPPRPATPRDRRRSSSRLLTASTPEAHRLPHLVAHDDAQVPWCGDLAHAAAPAVQADQGDADRLVSEGVEPGQRQRLDGGVPVDGDVGVVVEQAGQGTGDELAEGVAQQPSLVEEVLAVPEPALLDQGVGGLVEVVPQLRDGGLDQGRVSGGVPGEVAQGGLDDGLLRGPEGDTFGADALAADQGPHEGQPAAEHDGGAVACFLGRQLGPAFGERAQAEGVDPGGHPWA
jgi:hypothetical protein